MAWQEGGASAGADDQRPKVSPDDLLAKLAEKRRARMSSPRCRGIRSDGIHSVPVRSAMSLSTRWLVATPK
jgi:hypothetical protein